MLIITKHQIASMLIIVGGIIVVSLISSIGTPQVQEPPPDWLTYENKSLGYQVSYPKEWVADDSRLPEGSLILWSRRDYKEYIIPYGEGVSSGVYGVYIGAETKSPSIVTLDNYSRRMRGIKEAKKVIASKDLTIDGIAAKQDHLEEIGTFATMLVTYIQKGDKIYRIFTDYSTASNHAEAILQYDQILATFRFTN